VRNEFTAIIDKDADWYVAYCPEIPGAKGQGRTVDEYRASLAEANALFLEDRSTDCTPALPPRSGSSRPLSSGRYAAL